MEPPRKRFKISELPLTQPQRGSVDNLVHTFKKQGEFDLLRKHAYSLFEDGDLKNDFTTALTTFAESELERNHTLLGKDRRQSALLVEGAAERSDVYRKIEEDVLRTIEQALSGAEEKLRTIRVDYIGEDAAKKEQARGAKTDEDYAEESAVRRAAWARKREEEAEVERQRQAEEEQKRLEEERKKKEEEEERERQKAIEREEIRKKTEEREKVMAEYRALKARQDAQWKKEEEEKQERERKKREAEREKEMEAAALEELIREGKRAADRSAKGEQAARDGAAKESALAAIMRKEQLEREKAKLQETSRRSSEAGPGMDEASRRPSVSGEEVLSPSGGHIVRSNTSKVWVKDGGKKPRLGFSSTMKPATPTAIAPPTGPAASMNQYYEGYDQRDHHGRPPYTQDYPADYGYYERDRSSRHNDPYRGYPEEAQNEEAYYAKNYHSSSRRRHHDGRHDYGYDHDYEHDHRSSRRERHRSCSPRDDHRSSRHHRSSYRDRSRSPEEPRRRSRSRDPKDIDRYVPLGSSRAKKEYDAPRHRPSDAEREKKKPVEIDSYIPSTSIRARGKAKDQSRKESSPHVERSKASASVERTRSPSRS